MEFEDLDQNATVCGALTFETAFSLDRRWCSTESELQIPFHIKEFYRVFKLFYDMLPQFFAIIAALIFCRFILFVYNLRSLTVIRVLNYLAVFKSIYKRSSASCPPMCLLLQATCGLCRAFETNKIFRFNLGSKPVVIFFTPETVEVALNSSALLEKGHFYRFLHPWLGTGLITSSGAKWRCHRKLLTPTFHLSILDDFIPIFNEQSNILCSKLENLAGEPWLDIVPLITLCTLDIICETAMGVSINSQTGGCSDYVKAIYEVGEIFMYRMLRPWLYLDVVFNCCPSGRKFKVHLQRMRNFTRKVIKEKKENMIKTKKYGSSSESDENENPSQLKKRRAFLELLLEQHLKDPSFTEENMLEEVDTFMFGGHDTTAASLSWTLYSLGLYTDVQKVVHDELDDIFQDDPDREITRKDITEMKYLECVIKESLRLYPSIPTIGREVEESFEVMNCKVQRGSLCLIFPLILHRDPKEFPEPEKFDPERFFPESCARRHRYAYVPFSAGPRNCIGQKFAMMEEKTLLANILRRFRVVSLDPRDKINLTHNIILRNVQPLRLRFEPRR